MGLERETTQDVRSDATLAGVRRDATAVGKELARAAPERMLELLAKRVDAFAEMVMTEAIDKGDRTCRRIYHETLMAVGGRDALVNAIVVQVGASSVEHLTRAATRGLDAEGTDEETLYAQALAFVHRFRRERGLRELVEAA